MEKVLEEYFGRETSEGLMEEARHGELGGRA